MGSEALTRQKELTWDPNKPRLERNDFEDEVLPRAAINGEDSCARLEQSLCLAEQAPWNYLAQRSQFWRVTDEVVISLEGHVPLLEIEPNFPRAIA